MEKVPGNLEGLRDRIRGLIYGCALGDAVGLATEFMTKAEAESTYKELLSSRGEGSLLKPGDSVRDFHRSKWQPGDWTDDTDQLILILNCLLPDVSAAANGVIDVDVDAEDFANAAVSKGTEDSWLANHFKEPSAREFAGRLLRWHRKGFPELGDKSGCGMGRSTARVVEGNQFSKDPSHVARLAWDRTGRCVAPNGALMRAAASGLRGSQHAAADAKLFAETTHADPRSTAACVAVAMAVAALLRSTTIEFSELTALVLKEAEASLPLEQDLWKPAPPLWACAACTFENAAGSLSCEVCGTPKADDGAAGRVNAGFGVSWSAEEASDKKYSRATALIELRRAVLATEALPKLDDAQTMGYVNTCLAAGFHALRQAMEFCSGEKKPHHEQKEDAISKAAFFQKIVHNLTLEGGDADTNCAVAGALVGTYFGASNLPEEWLRLLPHRSFLHDLASRAASLDEKVPFFFRVLLRGIPIVWMRWPFC